MKTMVQLNTPRYLYEKNNMNHCLSCGKEVKNKYCNVSCQNKHQGMIKNNKIHGNFKEFTVTCPTCGKTHIVIEREKLHPQKNKYYCSRSCSNKRTISTETKQKIKDGVNRFLDINNKKCNLNKICHYCGITFAAKRKKQRFCSQMCAGKWVSSSYNQKRCNKIKECADKPKIFKLVPPKQNPTTTFIYALEYPKGNIRYIGKSDNPSKRLKKHINECRVRNKNHRDHWINSLDCLPFLTIIENVPYSEWQEKERYWIKFYKDKGYNLVNGTSGGDGSDGFKDKRHTNETKQKISEKLKNKQVTENTKLKNSGENNGRCKIKNDYIREIFNLRLTTTLTYKEIALKYNTSKTYIYQILTGKKRKDIFNEYKELLL